MKSRLHHGWKGRYNWRSRQLSGPAPWSAVRVGDLLAFAQKAKRFQGRSQHPIHRSKSPNDSIRQGPATETLPLRARGGDRWGRLDALAREIGDRQTDRRRCLISIRGTDGARRCAFSTPTAARGGVRERRSALAALRLGTRRARTSSDDSDGSGAEETRTHRREQTRRVPCARSPFGGAAHRFRSPGSGVAVILTMGNRQCVGSPLPDSERFHRWALRERHECWRGHQRESRTWNATRVAVLSGNAASGQTTASGKGVRALIAARAFAARSRGRVIAPAARSASNGCRRVY